MSELEKSFIELREANSKYSIEVLELRQEVARLREALCSILELDILGDDNQGKMSFVARKALEGGK